MIFVDTSAWFALLNPKSVEAPDAVATFLEIEMGRYGTPVTTDYVLDETYTLLRLRLGVPPVGRLAALLRQSPSVRRLRVNEAIFDESLKLMLSRPDKKWSFTDCTSFITMQQAGISRAFSWDHDFSEAGFELVPVPKS
jgi:uncharacterized protein